MIPRGGRIAAEDLQQFYEVIGGAAATLLGLLFVSVSMNAEIILSIAHKHSRTLAEQAFQNYLAVLVVSLLVLFPAIGGNPLGYTLLSISVVWAGWAAVRLVSTLAGRVSTDTARTVLRRYLSTLPGLCMIGFSALRMVTNTGDPTAYTATGTMLLLISATIASWELLINVAEEKYRIHKE
jgi:hypothetical protein